MATLAGILGLMALRWPHHLLVRRVAQAALLRVELARYPRALVEPHLAVSQRLAEQGTVAAPAGLSQEQHQELMGLAGVVQLGQRGMAILGHL